MKKVMLIAVAAAAMALIAAPQAIAQVEEPELTFCEGTLSQQVIEGHVVVGLDTACVLDRVTVEGDVIGTVDATSVVVKRSHVKGSLTCDGCRRVELDRSRVDGRLDVMEAGDGLDVCWSSVGGGASVRTTGAIRIGAAPTWNACGLNHFGVGLTIARGSGTAVVAYNVVDGPLGVTGRRGDTTIRRNVVNGALDCSANDPAPVGGGNVAVQRLGQCAAL